MLHAARAPEMLRANTGEALDQALHAGAISPTQHALLSEAWRLYSDLQQMLRVCVGGNLDPEAGATALMRAIAARIGAGDFESAASMLAAIQADVRAVFEEVIGALAEKPR